MFDKLNGPETRGKQRVWVYAILLFAVLGRVLVAPLPFNGDAGFHSDFSVHLHRIDLLKTQGFTDWDPFWYGGLPFLRFYPPLGPAVAAALPLPELDAYKLLLFAGFVLFPLTVFLLLKEFKLDLQGLLVGTLLVSFTPRFAEVLFYQNFGTTLALPFAFLFLKYFVRLFAEGELSKHGFALALFFLIATALVHTAVLAGAVVTAVLYAVFTAQKTGFLKTARLAGVLFASGFLATSFYYAPLLLEYAQSNFQGASSAGVSPGLVLKPLVFLVKTFSHFTNYSVLILAALAFLALSVFIAKQARTGKLACFEIVALTGFFVLLVLEPLVPGDLDVERMASFYGLPLALAFAAGFKDKKVKALACLVLAVQAIYFFNVITPTGVDLVEEKTVIASITGLDGRALIAPLNKFHNGLFYQLPASGIEVGQGVFFQGVSLQRGVFANRLDVFDCVEKLDVFDVLKKLDWFSKSSTTRIVECDFDSAALKKAMEKQFVKRVIVFKDSKAARAFELDPEFERVGETKRLEAFYFNSRSAYVQAGEGVNASFVKRGFENIGLTLSTRGRVENVSVPGSSSFHSNS